MRIIFLTFVILIVNSCKKVELPSNYDTYLIGRWKSVSQVNFDQYLAGTEINRDFSFQIGNKNYHEIEFYSDGVVKLFQNGILTEKGKIFYFTLYDDYSFFKINVAINTNFIKSQHYLEDIYLIEIFQTELDSLRIFSAKYEKLNFRGKYTPNHVSYIQYSK